MRIRPAPTPEARSAMEHIVAVSKRDKGLQLPHSFLRGGSVTTTEPPLARLVRGGRGGEVRLKLYLTAALIAGGPPHAYDRKTPSRAWAELLNLPDPSTAGARRISDAFAWLGDNRYLEVDRGRGRTTSFRLLSTALDGESYEKPAREYVTVPLGLWANHWISAVSGSELAVILAILDTPGDDIEGSTSPRFLTEDQRPRYGLSNDSWTRATKQLERIGALVVDRRVAAKPFSYRRKRSIYLLPSPTFSSEPEWPITVGEE